MCSKPTFKELTQELGRGPEPQTPPASQLTALDATDPAGLNAKRSEEALLKLQDAFRIRETPPDHASSALQPLEVRHRIEAAEALLEPGFLVKGGGEAIPALGSAEPFDAMRHRMVDTLERPTTVAVHASSQRMQLLHDAGVLQAGADASVTANARNSIEKMLSHQIAAGHAAAMNLFGRLTRMDKSGSPASGPAVEVARMGNTAARLMDACANVALALQKLQTGGTQRVVVQHQQVALTQSGPAVVIRPPRRQRRRKIGGSGRTRGKAAKNAE